MSHYLERFGRKMSFFLLTAAWNSPPQTVGGAGVYLVVNFFQNQTTSEMFQVQ